MAYKLPRINLTVGHQKSIIYLLSLAIISYASVSYATFPVIDYSAIVQMIKEFQQLQKQYQVLRQQLGQTQQLVKDAEGHYGFGSLLNQDDDMSAQRWSPNTWEDALQGLSGGNPERYQQLLESYQQTHPSLSREEYQAGASQAKAELYQQQRNNNRAASVNATYAFNEIQQHLDRVQQLSQKIESADNTKAARDLNSRLVTEMAYIQTQELKMQVLMNLHHRD